MRYHKCSMLHSNVKGPLPIWLIVLIVIVMIYSYLKSRNRPLLHKNTVDNNTSLLLIFYTRGNDIYKLSSGEEGNTAYKIFETIPGTSAIDKPMILLQGAVIYSFDLDFNSDAHIIGVGKTDLIDDNGVRNNLKDYKMEKVDLEGNFSDFFDVYCAPGQQSQTRYILNPKGMEEFMIYIQKNCWEIVGDQLYVVGSALDVMKGKNLTVLEDSVAFIKAIRPVIAGTPMASEVHHDVAYGEYNGPVLNCPICSKPMILTQNVHVCPSNEGILISGRNLSELHNRQLKLTIPTALPVKHDLLMCPSCKSTMQQSHYNDGPVVIDSCPNCTFRWLDADEIGAVTPKEKLDFDASVIF
jgi:hypothetical protein